tara:strand:- start:193 stop:444 length:252 start_codon:yes stop_codon:yes gene_type:complete
MNSSVVEYVVFVYSTVEKKEVTYTPRFSSIDEASDFANLLRATLPMHGFTISEPYPIVKSSLEEEFEEYKEEQVDLLGRLDEL